MGEQEYARELIWVLLSGVIPFALNVLTVAFILPLTRGRLVISIVSIIIVTSLVIADIISVLFFYSLIPFIWLISIMQWRAISRRTGTIFIAEVGDITEAVLIRRFDAINKRSLIVPICLFINLKARYLEWLIGSKAEIVNLRPRKVGGSYIAQSPTELALAEAANPNVVERFKTISIFHKQPNWTLKLGGPENELTAAIQSQQGAIFLRTDVLGPREGLFGFTTPSKPNLDDWRSICFFEMLLGNSADLDFPELAYWTEWNAAANPTSNNIVAHLAIRLNSFAGRYGPLLEFEDTNNLFELAHFGNLRAVALEFNRHAFEREFARTLWGQNFILVLLDYLSKSTLYTNKEFGGPKSKETGWLVNLMVTLVEINREGNLDIPIDQNWSQKKADKFDAEGFVREIQTAPLDRKVRAFSELLKQMVPDPPAPTFDGAQAQAIVDLPIERRRDQLVSWISSDERLRNHRVNLVFDHIDQKVGLRMFSLLQMIADFMLNASTGQVAKDNIPLELFGWLGEVESELSFKREVIELFDNQFLRGVIRNRIEAENRLLGFISKIASEIQPVMTGRGSEFPGVQEIWNLVERHAPSDLNAIVSAMRKAPSGRQTAEAFCDAAVEPGPPYSFREFVYVAWLLALFFDTESPSEIFSRAILKVDSTTQNLLRENRTVDRAAILSVSAELLDRWKPETAEVVWSEFAKLGLPEPTWKGALIW